MAINLWKLAGNLTSYKPLSSQKTVLLEVGEFLLTLRAKSESGARLCVDVAGNSTVNGVGIVWNTLTPEFTTYTFNVFNSQRQTLYILENGTTFGDIIIEDIELVEKPVPIRTDAPYHRKNLFDLSHLTYNYNWVVPASYVEYTLKPNTSYTLSSNLPKPGPGNTLLYFNGSNTESSGVWQENSRTFNSGTGGKLYVAIAIGRPYHQDLLNGKYYVQLEEGGVATEYEPYKERAVAKPKVLVPKKNLITGFSPYSYPATLTVLRDYDGYEVVHRIMATGGESNNFAIVNVPCKPSTAYTVSFKVKGKTNRTIGTYLRDNRDKAILDNSTITPLKDEWRSYSTTFITSANAMFLDRAGVFIPAGTNGTIYITDWQLEEGPVATPHEPYVEVLPKAHTGLPLDGRQYVELPPMTMDAIEMDIFVDPVQPYPFNFLFGNSTNKVLYQLGNASPNHGLGISEVSFDGSSVREFTWNALPKGRRTKISAKFKTALTGATGLFGRELTESVYRTKGILYGVKCYLKGELIAEYDFTNPANIVGDRVFQKTPRNLVPAFDDPRWSLHSRVIPVGPDVAEIDAVGIHHANINVPVKPNTSYLVSFSGSGAAHVRTIDETVTYVNALRDGHQAFTTNGSTSEVYLRLFTSSTGKYSFINPQLYELTGKEATIYGNPTPILKTPKRTLYARR